MSVNEVCRRLGVSKPAIYREFGGEDGLMVSVLEYYESIVTQKLLQLISDKDSFSRVLENILGFMTQERETPTGCLVVKMRLSPERLGPKSGEKLLEIRSRLRTYYMRILKKAIQIGEIQHTSSVEILAHFLENQFTMVLIQMSAGADVELIREQARLAFSGLLKEDA